MTEHEEFEFRARLEAEQEQQARPDGRLKFKTAPANSPDSLTGRIAAGAALGVADIGRTVLNAASHLPLPKSAQQFIRTTNADFDALTEANKDSMGFNLGRVGGNVVATLPVGGALAAGARGLGASAPLVASIASGGMRAGGMVGAAGMGVRATGGAITGGVGTALVNPKDAGTAAIVGAVLPGAVRASGLAGARVQQLAQTGAERLMQSAIKPTIKQLQTGDAKTAVNTLLELGINPTMKGVNILRDKIGMLNDEIGSAIAASPATVSKSNVLARLAGLQDDFANQVSPTADLKSIQAIADDFSLHPNYPGETIPVQVAQKLKQGTYSALRKKYGQVGSAEVEAQKGLARGLKEEIAAAVPEVAGLNALESKLITTLNVAERRALMELNKNPVGLAGLSSNPVSFALFMADKSALFKSLAARMINGPAAGVAGGAAPALEAGLSNPLLRNLAVSSVASER